MKIDKQQIEHLANLAKIGLTEEEKEKYSEQISSILDYVEKLNEVDTSSVEPVSQITGLKNVTRKDEVYEFGEENVLVSMAPDSENDMIKTKTVFGK